MRNGWALLFLFASLLTCVAGCAGKEFATFRGPHGDIAVCNANSSGEILSGVGGALDKCREAYLKNGYVEVK